VLSQVIAGHHAAPPQPDYLMRGETWQESAGARATSGRRAWL